MYADDSVKIEEVINANSYFLADNVTKVTISEIDISNNLSSALEEIVI